MIGEHTGDFPRIEVGSVPFEVTNLSEAVEFVIEAATHHRALPIRLANAYCVAVAFREKQYNSLLRGSGLNFPDGTPVVWSMQRNKYHTKPAGRVRGPSLFVRVIDKGRESNLNHFFLGTTPATLDRMQNQIASLYPGTEVVGSLAPPFGPLDEQFYTHAVSAIELAKPDLVWVALGSPKQDYAAARLAEETGLTCIAVGAAFDFLAGTAPEAPPWVQNSGFEWVYRLSKDPKRLWKRYFFGNAQFLAALVVYRRNKKK